MRNCRWLGHFWSLIVFHTMSASRGSSLILKGQRILVTGAGRGIGRAMAHICHAQGARVAICARSLAELNETAASSSFDVAAAGITLTKDNSMLILPCDVTKEEEVEKMVREIVNQWGGLDVLINNAGGGQAVKGTAETLQSTDLRSLLNLNVVAVHTVTSAVLRHCATLRSIVNVSSRAAKMGIPGNAFYCASKFALEGYSATLAEELRNKNCLVNTISPGMVDTRSFPKATGVPGVRTPESIREGFLLLLRQDTITGHYLHVDELDEARAKGLPDSTALKPINEPKFSP
jgi:NAD(P)-dependent dehydrogenase (short-subunit alcohol dehydrogenase family)